MSRFLLMSSSKVDRITSEEDQNDRLPILYISSNTYLCQNVSDGHSSQFVMAVDCSFRLLHQLLIAVDSQDGKTAQRLPCRPPLQPPRTRLAWRLAAGSISTTVAHSAADGRTERRTALAFVRDQRARESTLARGTVATRSGRYNTNTIIS